MKIKRQTLSQSGVSAIEFALLLPLLILFLFGIIEFGALFYDKAMLTNASREGAREGINYVWSAGCTDSGNICHPSDADIITVVNDYCLDRLISFSSGSPLPTTDVQRPDGDAAGGTLQVNVSYDYGWLLLPNFATDLSIGDLTLTATTEMRLE